MAAHGARRPGDNGPRLSLILLPSSVCPTSDIPMYGASRVYSLTLYVHASGRYTCDAFSCTFHLRSPLRIDTLLNPDCATPAMFLASSNARARRSLLSSS